MNFFNPKSGQDRTPPPPLELLSQAFTSLQTHFSSFLHHSPLPTLRTPPWASTSNTNPSSSSSSPFQDKTSISDTKSRNLAMSIEAIEERLAGVPVYALSNSSEEFVLVSGSSSGKNLGLFCFNEADAQTLLQEMQSIDPSMRKGSQVVPVALNKVFQLKVDGVAFRLIPEPSQVKNAIKERKNAGTSDESFSGVPVFQFCRHLIWAQRLSSMFHLSVRSCPLYLKEQLPISGSVKKLGSEESKQEISPNLFRKEDLEKSLLRASRNQNVLNPSFRVGDVQVAVLEDIIQGMKDGSSSQWDDVVFIPPGYDVSTVQARQ